MKLIKKHQFGGLFGSLQKYSLKNNRVPPIGNYRRMGPLEPDIKKVLDIPTPNIDNSVKPDALNLNKQNITPIPKSIYTPYNKFLYDRIFTDSSGKPFEYLETEYNPNTKGVTWDIKGNHAFRKRYLNSLEALNFLNSKRTLLLGNNLKYAMKYHQSGGRVLPTAPPAEQRYTGGKRVTRFGKEFGDSVSVRGVEAQSPWYKHPALIVERIRHSKVSPEFNDTTYAERPEFLGFVTPITRSAGNDYLFGKKIRYNLPIVGGFVNANYDKSTPQEQQEYDTLKKRFNTAWGVAKQLLGGELPTAPKAEDRYKEGRKEITIVHPYDVRKFGFRGTQPIRKVNSGSASISEVIRDVKDGTPADTMYYEIPNHLPFVNVQPRYSFSYGNLSSKYGFNSEFNILKRRFNTAWNLAK